MTDTSVRLRKRGPAGAKERQEDDTMHVERISTLEGLDAERSRWEALEALDPHVTMFTTWRWLRAYLPVTRYRWTVLALRDGDDTVAYLPIARNRSPIDREMFLGGNPLADYTGMVTRPDRAEAAVSAFADFIAA